MSTHNLNISKAGHLFGAAALVGPVLEDVLRKLHGENCLIGLGPHAFAQRGAFYMGEINAIHPFRDGNGRAQREFIRQVALQAGFVINWSRINREQMMAASREKLASALPHNESEPSGLAMRLYIRELSNERGEYASLEPSGGLQGSIRRVGFTGRSLASGHQLGPRQFRHEGSRSAGRGC